jgi:short-subunit dehydrogenase
MKSKDLGGKIVVITGASSGFGRGAALRFAREGALLALAARRGEVLEDLAVELEREGHDALAVPTDVSHEREVERLAEETVQKYGRIDVWINDAGVGAIGPFERIPLADHVKVIETNLLGTLYGTYFAYRQFIAQGEGTLINISSELGKHTVPYYSSYAAAKHGVVGLDESLRQEIEQLGRKGIHVCTVLPTAHDTPFFDHAANYTGRETRPPAPLHHPEGVVEAILHLARDPEDSKVVGFDGIAKILLHSVAPALSRKVSAKQMHATQMEQAPLAPNTGGAVQTPSSMGTDVSGGRREESS